MKYLMIIFSLLIFSFNGDCTVLSQDLDKQINITLNNKQYDVGTSIPLGITYTNNGNELLSFRDPEKTWEVKLSIQKLNGNEEQVSLGRLTHSEHNGVERTIIEEAEVISLGANKRHSFQLDIGKRWSEFFTQGDYILQIVDESSDDKTVVSNKLSVKIVRSCFRSVEPRIC